MHSRPEHAGRRARRGLAAVLAAIRDRVCRASLSDLPPAIALRVRLEQVNYLSVVMTVMGITGFGTVPLVMYEYSDFEPRAAFNGAVAVIAACYAYLIVTGLRWMRRGPLGCGGAERARRAFVRICALLGISWGGLILVLMGHSDAAQRTLLSGLIIGLMSSPAMVAPCSAALAFWLPITTSGLVAISFVSATRDIGTALLTLGYTALTLFCLVYLNVAFIRRVVAEVRQSDARETIDLLLREFEDTACDWLWETDRYGRLTHVSSRFAEVAASAPERMLGAELAAFIEHRVLGRHEGRLAVMMACRMPFRDLEFMLEVGGRRVWWSLTGKPKFSPDNIFDGYRGVGSDITERKAAVERATYLANYDELTGLANRRLFRESLTERLRGTGRASLALICLDLDGFKEVNDRHGHPVGDMLLRLFGERLRGLVRENDLCARLGGDEFAIIVGTLTPDAAGPFTTRLIEELSRPYLTATHALSIGVSVGIAWPAAPDTSSEELLREADVALYEAKADGRATWRAFDSGLSRTLLRRRMLQGELRDAIRAGALHLAFQPIYRLDDGALAAAEALARWTRGNGEVVGPAEFVPLAEECGLIGELGQWVLGTACRAMEAVPEPVHLAVNLSPLQLRDRAIVGQIAAVLAATRFDPYRLELELTETAFLEMNQPTLDLLDEIRALGIGVNLDDFGVGQTSLGQLRRYPFSMIKIDQSFVRDLPTSRASKAIVRGVAGMAHELGIGTTAEGVETAEHLQLVKELGCGYAQGDFLGAPARIEAILDRIRPAVALTPG